MDTVFNDKINGPFLQTFKLIDIAFTLIIYQETLIAEKMIKGIDYLEELLSPLSGEHIFVILTDRESEFLFVNEIENRKDGSNRFKLFFCDAMVSYQKGSLENNHEEIRYILPKKTNIKELGFTSQEKANLISSNINSFRKENLKGKTPFELVKFYYPEIIQPLNDFGIKEIPQDKVILKPTLLK